MDPLFVAGAVVSAAIAGVVAWGRVRAIAPRRVDTWPTTPTLWYGPGVDAISVGRALDVWRGLGHVIERVASPAAGITIVVDPSLGVVNLDGDHTDGLTMVSALDHRIVRASIRVATRADAVTIAHEIGHALGYKHPLFCPTGHLMHPRRPGWDTRGLENEHEVQAR